jgi:formylglycine-generating enzyme required for sulfatase activity
MVYVPAGDFLMGSGAGEANASPEHELFVDGFYVDRSEVTNKEFQAFRPDFVFSEGQEAHPVSGVSWEDANGYCESVSKRLPTEAEWEKAARGTDGLTYPWGNEFDSGRVNTEEAEKKGTLPVGQYSVGASPYGAYDMAGNVAEWTASWYAAYPGNSSPDPDYGSTFKTLRGGSWFMPKEQATTFARLHDNPNAKRAYYGFRCAIAPQQLAALAEKAAREEALRAAEEEIEREPAPPVERVPEGFVEKVLLKARELLARLKDLVGHWKARLVS